MPRSLDELRRVYDAERPTHPHWPAFEVCLADDLLSSLLKLLAHKYVFDDPIRRYRFVDFKSAAANDRQDD